MIWETYFTDKYNRFKTKDWLKKEYYWSWLWESELIHIINNYNNIATSLILDAFCIPVTIKEINNEKIILDIKYSFIELFWKECTINKYQPVDDLDTVQTKNKIIYFIWFLSENFINKKSRYYIKLIEKEIYWIFEHTIEDKDIDDFINNLRNLFKEFIYTLNGKEKTLLLEQEFEQNLSIQWLLIIIMYYLYSQNWE